MAVQNIFINAVSNFGNDKQKREFIPEFSNGENIGSFSLSEPGKRRNSFDVYACC